MEVDDEEYSVEREDSAESAFSDYEDEGGDVLTFSGGE